MRRSVNTPRKVSALNFDIRPKIKFDISGISGMGEKFLIKAAENNTDGAKLLRRFLMDGLNIKSELEFINLPGMEKIYKDFKNNIYENLNVSRKNSFSKTMSKKVEDYIKDE